MLTVDVAATSELLVELGTVKTELGIADASQDDRLTRLITAASEAIAEHLGYLPWRQTYTETVPGKGGPDILLSQMPVQSVSAVAISGLTVTDYVIEDPSSGVLWRQNGWPWQPNVPQGTITPTPIRNTEKRNVEVTYIAGWLMPGEVGRDLPVGIEQAALETVLAWHTPPGSGGGSSSSAGPLVEKQIGDTRLRYADPTEANSTSSTTIGQEPIPAMALARLRPYRRDIAWSH